MDEKINGFDLLKKEVIDRGICSGCRACIAVCSKGIISFEDEKPSLNSYNEKDCYDCELCYSVCPRSSQMLDEIEAYIGNQEIIGPTIKICSGKSKLEEVRTGAQDGGIVTSILLDLFDYHFIDGAIVIKNENWMAKPVLITDRNELVQCEGTVYAYNSPLQLFKEYEKIKNKIKEIKHGVDLPRLAIVGLPCQIKAIRKMKLLSPGEGIIPSDLILITIGLFCFENFDYKRFISLITKKAQIDLNEIVKMDISSGKLYLNQSDGSQKSIPVKDLSDAMRNGCSFCKDFTNKFADISVGSVGSSSGYSTVIIRTEIGEKFYTHTLLNDYILEKALLPKDINRIKKVGEIKFNKH
ncbi:MAG: 4Fe-4S dicluster domain-containing protein [Promethearchaeota archaeon]|nr:MAG: 4Fe-4S dicluster domain-containing protein [Candidatus Lokiarchaeota archaeon]